MEKERKIGPFVRSWLARDGLYIVALMIALTACLYTYSMLDNVTDQCDQLWEEHIRTNCFCSGLQEPEPILHLPNETITEAIQYEDND